MLGVPAPSTDWETAKEHIIPTVVPRWSVEAITLRALAEGHEAPDVAMALLAEHFAVCIVYVPEGTTHAPLVRTQDLQTWNVTWDEAFGAAHRNVRQSLTTGSALWFQLEGGCWEGRRPDETCARQLLLPGHFGQLALDGDPVVIVARRDRLFVTGLGNDEGLVELARQAEAAMEEGPPGSGIALRLREDTWEVYLPPDGHPALPGFERLAVRTKAMDYTAQGRLLERIHSEAGDHVFVASYTVVEHAGRYWAYCLWSEEQSALLPRTEKVLFVRASPGHPFGERVGLAPWDQVASVVGDRIQLVRGLWPERWRTAGFPTAEEFEGLDLELPRSP